MADLPNRSQLESSFARRLALASAQRRREFVRLLGDPPLAANIPDTFWQGVQDDLEEDAFLALLLILAASSSRHGLSGADQQLAPQARNRAKLVAAGYVHHSREMAQVFMPDLELAKQDVQNRAAEIFGPARDARLAVSETTWGISQGGEWAIKATVGLSEDDTWYTVRDKRVCPICQPLDGRQRSAWTRLFPDGPPAHPFCRCWIQYAREKEAQSVGQ